MHGPNPAVPVPAAASRRQGAARGFAGALALAALCGAPASAQCPIQWELASAGVPTNPNDPPIRQNHAAAFDAARGQLIIHGGFLGGFGFYGDTWAWNGTAWTQVATSGPVARSVLAMAYDAQRQVIVLFGGSNGTAMSDTWEWNGTAWNQATPAASPAARFNHAMAYDSVRNVVVLTGGFGATRYNDTWEYNGTTWTQRTEPGFTNFVGRNGHAMGFDPVRNRMVIFGGFGGSPVQRLADTWEMGPTGWTQIVAPGPSGRQYLGSLVYHPGHQLMYIFGGQTGPAGADRSNELWSWNGTAWALAHEGTAAPTPVPPGEPNRRDQHITVFDPVRNEIVVFGGFQGTGLGGVAGDTWTAACPPVACYPNCDGSTQPPILNVQDFSCFLTRYAAGETYANCDGSTQPPVLNVQDFSCFLTAYAAGCR